MFSSFSTTLHTNSAAVTAALYMMHGFRLFSRKLNNRWRRKTTHQKAKTRRSALYNSCKYLMCFPLVVEFLSGLTQNSVITFKKKKKKVALDKLSPHYVVNFVESAAHCYPRHGFSKAALQQQHINLLLRLCMKRWFALQLIRINHGFK